MKLIRYGLVAGALTVAGILAAHAAGSWSNLPGIGQAAFCTAYNAASSVVTGTTGQQGSGICVQTVPAGPPLFVGTEYAPFDIGPLGGSTNVVPSTATVGIIQLGQGPYLDVLIPTTATIPNNTPFYLLDGNEGSAFTVTMPSAPVEGQIQHVVCESTTVGALTVVANTGQTVKNNPGTACTAGTTYHWRWMATNATWYRF